MVDKDEVAEFRRLVTTLPTTESMNKMKSEIDETIKEFKADNDMFRKEFPI